MGVSGGKSNLLNEDILSVLRNINFALQEDKVSLFHSHIKGKK